MPRERSDFGFWRSFGRLRLSQFVRLEAVAATILGMGMGLLASHVMTRAERIALAGDYLVLAAALIAVVFAGFSLVVGLMSDRYAVWLASDKNGVQKYLSPFLVSTGIQVLALLLTVAYRGIGPQLPRNAELTLFGITTGVFVYAALDVVVLSKTVLAHGVTRADAAVIAALEDKIERDRSRADQDPQ